MLGVVIGFPLHPSLVILHERCTRLIILYRVSQGTVVAHIVTELFDLITILRIVHRVNLVLRRRQGNHLILAVHVDNEVELGLGFDILYSSRLDNDWDITTVTE